MASRLLSPLAALAAVLLSPVPTTAQVPPSFEAQVDVNLVNVEVFVTDADGRPVNDLTAADFRLLEDGEPVAISYFTPPAAVPAASPAAASVRPAPSAEAAPPLHLVLFVDEANPGSSSRRRTLLALQQDLLGQLPAGSQVMVVLFEQGPHVVLPFTADRKKIAEMLDAVSLHLSPRRLLGDRERIDTLENLHRDSEIGPCLYGDAIARNYAEMQKQLALETVGALERLVGSLDGLAGRKALVYVGDGVPLRPGEEAIETYISLCAGESSAQGLPDARDTSLLGPAHFHRPDPQKLRLEFTNYDTSQSWTALAARANGQGVSFFTLAAGGAPKLDSLSAVEQRRDVLPTAAASAERGRLETLQLLAEETGARLAYAGGGLDLALARWRDDLSRFYLLGFTPARPQDLRVRRLRLEVTRPGLTVRHRQSYALRSSDERIQDRLLSRLLYGAGENRLAARLAVAEAKPAAALPIPPPAGAPRIPSAHATRLRLQVPIARLTLLPDSGRWRGLFTVYVMSRDEHDAATPMRRAAIPVNIADAEIDAARGHDFVWETELPLEAGPHEVALAIRDELSGETSYLGQKVVVRR